jgi:Protein of unknown function (DUF2917)
VEAFMDGGLARAEVMRLPAGGTLHLRHAQRQRISVVKGLVWVTQEGDLRDVFLKEGESFTFDRPGLALTQALEEDAILVLGGGLDAASRSGETYASTIARSIDRCTLSTRT